MQDHLSHFTTLWWHQSYMAPLPIDCLLNQTKESESLGAKVTPGDSVVCRPELIRLALLQLYYISFTNEVDNGHIMH